MLYKEFGKTKKKVSVLGFGGMRFEPKEYMSSEGMEKCAEIVLKANELGINYFDTAPGYCGGRSEDIFGIAFPKMPNPFYVSTKSKLSDDPDEYAVQKRIENSLKKLKVDKIDFYNMWCILDYEQYCQIMRKGGPYDGAVKAKEEGLIDHICFSAHCDGNTLKKIIADDAFEGVTLGYNIANSKFREEGIKAAYEKGLGVVTMNTLGGGVIPNNPQYFSFIKDNESDDIVASALRYNISHEAISVALSGMSSMEEVVSNVKCIDIFSPDKKYVERVNARRDGQMNDLCTGCNYCSGCPKGISVSKMMLSYNEYVFSGKNDVKLRHDLKHKWNKEEFQIIDCIGCKRCESRCTQQLPIISRIAEINGVILQHIENTKEQMNKYFGDCSEKKIGVYGIGALAKEWFDKYCVLYPDVKDRIYLFDKDPNKWGKTPLYSEWVIERPAMIKEQGIDRIIVCSDFYYKEIEKELREFLGDKIEIEKYTLTD